MRTRAISESLFVPLPEQDQGLQGVALKDLLWSRRGILEYAVHATTQADVEVIQESTLLGYFF